MTFEDFQPKHNQHDETLCPKDIMLSTFTMWQCWCNNLIHCMVCNQDIYTAQTYEVIMKWRQVPDNRTEYLKTVCSDCLETLKKEYIESDEKLEITDKILSAITSGKLYYTDRVVTAQTRPTKIDLYGYQEGQLKYIHSMFYLIMLQYKRDYIFLEPRHVDEYGIYESYSYMFNPPIEGPRMNWDKPISKLCAKIYAEDTVLASGWCDWGTHGPYRNLDYYIDIDRRGNWMLQIQPSHPCDYTLA